MIGRGPGAGAPPGPAQLHLPLACTSCRARAHCSSAAGRAPPFCGAPRAHAPDSDSTWSRVRIRGSACARGRRGARKSARASTGARCHGEPLSCSPAAASLDGRGGGRDGGFSERKHQRRPRLPPGGIQKYRGALIRMVRGIIKFEEAFGRELGESKVQAEHANSG